MSVFRRSKGPKPEGVRTGRQKDIGQFTSEQLRRYALGGHDAEYRSYLQGFFNHGDDGGPKVTNQEREDELFAERMEQEEVENGC